MRENVKHLGKAKYHWLLIALIAVLGISPEFEGMGFGWALQKASLSLVFITAVLANRQRPRIFVAGIVVALICIPLTWTPLLLDNVPLSLANFVVSVLFLLATAVLILISVFRDYHATTDAVMGAACVYLLLGLTWALLYSAIDFMHVDAFAVAHRTPLQESHIAGHDLIAFSQMVYFSFVTLSTLGYGDMTPRCPAARTATWMEAVAGQFYLAVLVARLVSVLPYRNKDEE